MNDQNITKQDRLSIDLGERLGEAARLISDARGPVLILSPDYAAGENAWGGVDVSLVIIEDGHIGTTISAAEAVGALQELFRSLHAASEALKAEGAIESLASNILQHRADPAANPEHQEERYSQPLDTTTDNEEV